MEMKLIEQDGLIKVYQTDTGEYVVDGRELWQGLGSKQEFSNWIKKRINDTDAEANVHYFTIDKKINRQTLTEYVLKLDTAKEMAMLERNEVGKRYRKYFIEVEKKYKEIVSNPPVKQMSPLEILELQVQTLKALSQKQEDQGKEITALSGRFDKMQEAYIISPEDDWREWSDKEIKKVALAEGGYQFIRDIRHKIYAELERRYGVNLSVRLKNLKKRWEEAGKSKTAIKNLNFLDVIAEDKKLIEGYMTIVKEYSISII